MSPPARVPSPAYLILALAAAYAVAAQVGLALASEPGNVTTLWPPSGIGLIGLLLGGRRLWPGIFLGSLLANLAVFPAEGGALVAGAAFTAVGSSLELVVAATLVERWANGRSAARSPRSIVRFAFACAAAGLIGAVAGLGATAIFGSGIPDPVQFAASWWAGDTVGMVVITPLVLRDDAPSRRGAWPERLAVTALTLLLGQVLFGAPLPWPTGTRLPIAFLSLLPVLWAAGRLGSAAVAVQLVVAHACTSWGTAAGRGPLVALPEPAALVVVDLLLGTGAMAGLLLASARAQATRRHARLAAHEAALEGEVAERTRRLEAANAALLREAEERLQLAQRLVAAEKQQAVSRLAAGVAHDFNNLLTVIFSEAEHLATRTTDPEVRESADAILTAGTRASDLTRQLLGVAGERTAPPRRVDAAEILAESRRMLRPLLPPGVVLEVHEPNRPCPVEIDPTQLGQILLNLMINARDAIGASGRLSVGAEVRSRAEREWVVLTVADSGEGIDPQVLPRIFEPFFTTKPEGRGSGLGLSSAMGIVTGAGGSIEVRSQLGEGTTFEVWLPLAEEGGATILVVDDEQSVLALAEDVLRRDGHRVIVARDGRDALAQAHAHSGTIDLVLADVTMPRMSGPDMVNALRRERAIRALFMSGDVASSGDLGSDTLLAKPFSAAGLARAVRAALGA